MVDVRTRLTVFAGAAALMIVGGLLATVLITSASAHDDGDELRASRIAQRVFTNELARKLDLVEGRMTRMQKALKMARERSWERSLALRSSLRKVRAAAAASAVKAAGVSAAGAFPDHECDFGDFSAKAFSRSGDFGDWDHDDWDHDDWDHDDWDRD